MNNSRRIDIRGEFTALYMRPPRIAAKKNEENLKSRQSRIYADSIRYSREIAEHAWARFSDIGIEFSSGRSYRLGLTEDAWRQILDIPFTMRNYDDETFSCTWYAKGFLWHCIANFGINGVAYVSDPDALSDSTSDGHAYNAILIAETQRTCRWQLVEPKDCSFVDIGKKYPCEKGFALLP